MKFSLHRRANIGWQNFTPGEAESLDSMIRTLLEGRGVVKVYAGDRTIYRSAEDMSQWTEAMNGRGDVKQLNEEGFRATLTGWDENEGAALAMLDRVFGDSLNIKDVELTKEAMAGEKNKKY